MKHLLILSVIFISCNSHSSETTIHTKRDTIVVHDSIYAGLVSDTSWQQGFGLTHDPHTDSVWGKPVSYYLDDPGCASIAFEFYYGYFRPSDNGATDELLKYAVTGNNKLRPFYRWCLNKTIQVADGALSEHTGEPALNYAIKFPKEFFQYMDDDSSGNRYTDWVGEISYSGINAPDDKTREVQINKLVHTMRSNCKNCDAAIIKRIDKFAKDCY